MSFVTHNWQIQFLRVPFGLSNSPSVFQRHVNAIFRDLTCKGVAIPYVDDIIIPAKSEKEAVEHIIEVLTGLWDWSGNAEQLVVKEMENKTTWQSCQTEWRKKQKRFRKTNEEDVKNDAIGIGRRLIRLINPIYNAKTHLN